MLSEGISLLKKFEAYKQKHPSASLQEFGEHLAAEKKSEQQSILKNDDLRAIEKQMPFPFPANSIDEYIGWIWGRLQGFTQIWEKKSFQSLPISNLSEFGIIMYVLSHPACNKTEVAAQTLQEKTTVFEIIKRLVKSGILVELTNENDRRSKLLSLSDQGKHTAFSILKRTAELSKHITGELTESEKFSLFHQLAKLDRFHTDCHERYKNSEWEEIIS